jgi:Tfp pilus assembly protein PilF
MRLLSVLVVTLLALSAAPLAADAPQIDPTYAAAHNNLAIAWEHEGDLDKARAAYEKALELEPNNAFIKQNYELFKEINDRTSRQDTQ